MIGDPKEAYLELHSALLYKTFLELGNVQNQTLAKVAADCGAPLLLHTVSLCNVFDNSNWLLLHAC